MFLDSGFQYIKDKMSGFRLQSAMEYLMTYGWAILIIAVVLGALAYLGIFNSNGLAPKAQPGSCSVYRPNGAGSSSFVNLEGVCNGELPEYVSVLNGQSSYISFGSNPITGTSAFTMTGWLKAGKMSTYGFAFAAGNALASQSAFIGYVASAQAGTSNSVGGGIYGANYGSGVADTSWHFVVLTFSGGSSGTATLYVDSVPKVTNTITPSLQSAAMSVGKANAGTSYWYNGSVANLQFYNTSFSQNDVTTLYDEGIGGAPIALPWIVAWWPLNGNANDYSGNGNNPANTVNVIFTNSWASSYTAP